MFIKYTENFKPCDPSTHERFEKGEKLQGMIVAIKTPQGQLVPYSPEDHNDPTRADSIKEKYDLLPMCYSTYCRKTKDARNLKKQAEAARTPTQEEIAIITSEDYVDAYIAKGFDPSKKDKNEKYDPCKHLAAEEKILVLKKKIYGGGYHPYVPNEHDQNPNERKSIIVRRYNARRTKAYKKYQELLKNKNSNSTITTTTTTTTTSDQAVAAVRAPTLFLGMPVPNPNTLFKTPAPPSNISNQVIEPKRFNPIILVHNYERISAHQSKRTAEDSVISIPSFTRDTFNLFQQPAQNDRTIDTTQPKRFRPGE